VVRFFSGGHVESLETRRLATPSSPAGGDDAVMVVMGSGVTPFSAADSPRAFGRIMPRAAWAWTDRAMQRSFHCSGASEALGRKEATAAAPPRFLSVWAGMAHPTEGAKATRGRCRRSEAEAGDTKGEGGGRRGVDLSGWLPPFTACPACKTGCTPRSLGDPFSLLVLPSPHDPLLALRFLPSIEGADDPGDDVLRRHPDRFEPLNGCQLTNLGRDRQHRTIWRCRLVAGFLLVSWPRGPFVGARGPFLVSSTRPKPSPNQSPTNNSLRTRRPHKAGRHAPLRFSHGFGMTTGRLHTSPLSQRSAILSRAPGLARPARCAPCTRRQGEERTWTANQEPPPRGPCLAPGSVSAAGVPRRRPR